MTLRSGKGSCVKVTTQYECVLSRYHICFFVCIPHSACTYLILSTLIFQLYRVYLQKVLWCHLNNERNYLQQHLFHCGQFPVSAICSTVTLESPSFWAVITLVGNCSAGGALPFAKCNVLHSCQCMHSMLHSVYSYVKWNMLQPALHYCYLLH